METLDALGPKMMPYYQEPGERPVFLFKNNKTL
jgi:hypothetical protein